jgi:hypothetical protein
VALLLFACDQDPLFDMISREVKPREPRIKGVPTKMVVFDTTGSGDWGMYVADTSLHRYARGESGQGTWDAGSIPQPPGKIFDLAATTDALYALINIDSPELYRFSSGTWEPVDTSATGAYPRLQTIYGETGSDGKPTSANLYLGAMNSASAYAVFHTTGTVLSLLVSETKLLTGAAYDGSTNHYFSTDRGGVYAGTSFSASGFSNIATDVVVKGMIQLPSATIVALCYDGSLYTVSASGLSLAGTTGVNLPGAAAVYSTDTTSLLVTAIVSGTAPNSIYGYRELELSGGGLPGTVTMKEPGTAPSTVDDTRRYQDTIEPKPVNAIFQAPADVDSERTLFASVQGRGTAKDNTDGGLWSYRSRGGVWQWNAEE